MMKDTDDITEESKILAKKIWLKSLPKNWLKNALLHTLRGTCSLFAKRFIFYIRFLKNFLKTIFGIF